jgi:hypothetical protein
LARSERSSYSDEPALFIGVPDAADDRQSHPGQQTSARDRLHKIGNSDITPALD